MVCRKCSSELGMGDAHWLQYGFAKCVAIRYNVSILAACAVWISTPP